MKKEDVIKEGILLFWIFILGSLLGYIVETAFVLFRYRHFEIRQGLIYGPFIPVYGIGGVMYYVIFKKIPTKEIGKVFLMSMVLGGITEYLCSYIQEKVFGTISWDYSNMMFNFHGRTSLLQCTYWGLIGVFYVTCISPQLAKIEEKIKEKPFRIFSYILLIFMILDVSISWMAVERQTERGKNIEPQNRIDVFLDEHYPEERLQKIFINMKTV